MLDLSVNFKIELAFVLVISTVYSLISFISIWAGLSSRHWLLRVTVLAACSLLLLPTGLNNAALFIALFVTMTACGAFVLCWNHGSIRDASAERSKIGWRFSFRLSDLFKLTLVVGLLLTIWRLTKEGESAPTWVRMITTSITTAASTLTGAWLVLGRGRLGWRWISFALTTTIASLVWCAHDWWGMSYIYLDPSVEPPPTLPGTIIVVFVIWMTLSRVAGFPISQSYDSKRWPRIKRLKLTARCLLITFILLALAPTGWLYWTMIQPLPAKHPMFANPNGYQQFLAVVERLGNDVSFVGYSSDNEIAGFVNKHKQSFHHLRSTLDMAWQIPIEYSFDDTLAFNDQVRKGMYALESLAHHARLNGQMSESALISLDCIRLGDQSTRGGLQIQWMTGVAVEEKGVKQLRIVLGDLNPTLCREVILALNRIDANRESLDEILQRDEVWERHVCGRYWFFLNCLYRLAGEKHYDLSADLRRILNRRDYELRLLIVDLAIQAFQETHKKSLENLNDLIPVFLTESPIDPYTKKPFTVSKSETASKQE